MPPTDLNTCPLPDLYRLLAQDGCVERLFGLMRDEDLGPTGLDMTSRVCIGPEATLCAHIVSRQPGMLAGLEAIEPLCKVFQARVTLQANAHDGQAVAAGQSVATLSGNARDLLTVERPILNLLGRLSGVATRTQAFITAMASCSGATQPHAKLYDTRKTTPGLRHLEKYAVRCGGGSCHRIGLCDALLIKDNHIACAHRGGLALRVEQAARRAQSQWPDTLRFVMVEVDSLDQLNEILALPAGLVEIVLLDNMDCAQLEQAVELRNEHAPALQLEASGSVTLKTIAKIAQTGVDRISVGSLTHHAVWLDFGLDVGA